MTICFLLNSPSHPICFFRYVMRILTSNVAGINSERKRTAALSFARAFDISFLQETKLSRDRRDLLQSCWGLSRGDVFLSGMPSARRGVVSIFQAKLNASHIFHLEDVLGQFLINIAVIDELSYFFINFYGDPDTDQLALATLDRLGAALDNLSHLYHADHIVLGGDFNCVLDPQDSHSTSQKPLAEQRLQTLLDDFDLHDVAALKSWPVRPLHTYFCHRREVACHA